MYRGRLAPSPTGWLHLGHASTFWQAFLRARAANGALILRIEDLDGPRCRKEFFDGIIQDLRWFGLNWQEGPDCGGPFSPYVQSERQETYRAAFETLKAQGLVYPCACSRKDVLEALQAPHAGFEEPVYPGTCRPAASRKIQPAANDSSLTTGDPIARGARKFNWRFRVPDGEVIAFDDGCFGMQRFSAGTDFGDFVVWRHDGLPSYQLAVVADDSAMKITEVVRGADLLLSTARQSLLYRALGLQPPAFYHCPLITDKTGARLAKRHDALSLRQLRQQGFTPETLRKEWAVFA